MKPKRETAEREFLIDLRVTFDATVTVNARSAEEAIGIAREGRWTTTTTNELVDWGEPNNARENK